MFGHFLDVNGWAILVVKSDCKKYFRIASIFNDLFYYKIVFIYTERDSAKKRKIEIATICTI